MFKRYVAVMMKKVYGPELLGKANIDRRKQVTIFRSLKCRSAIISSVGVYTAKDLIHSYLSLEAWRFNISEGCYNIGRAVQAIQYKARRKILFKT